jgi:hypothetical protein
MIVLDEHLQGLELEDAIARWYRGTVVIVKTLRPGTVIKDDAIPTLLRRLKQPTFVTINYADTPISGGVCQGTGHFALCAWRWPSTRPTRYLGGYASYSSWRNSRRRLHAWVRWS